MPSPFSTFDKMVLILFNDSDNLLKVFVKSIFDKESVSSLMFLVAFAAFLKDIFKADLFSSITSIRDSEDLFMLFTDWERFSRVF